MVKTKRKFVRCYRLLLMIILKVVVSVMKKMLKSGGMPLQSPSSFLTLSEYLKNLPFYL